MIEVIVDTREVNRRVLAYLQANSQLNVRIEQLNVGDYQFENKIIFERKTIGDFAKSIIDGRLFVTVHTLLSDLFKKQLHCY